MARRGSRRDVDSDDWFAEPSPSDTTRAGAPERSTGGATSPARGQEQGAEDWLSDEGPGRRALPSRGARRSVEMRVAALAGGAIVLLLIALAAAGVFSGGGTRKREATAPAVTTVPTAPRPATTAVRPPTRTLAPGASGADVKLLQRTLTRLGYSPGGMDGRYGPATKAAVARFQGASGLTADGIVGPRTLAALTRALEQSG